MKSHTSLSSILDLCSGSGCIALALKKNFPNAVVSGVDISTDAIKLATENAILNQVELSFLEKDILAQNLTFLEDESVDLIISNPPYVMEEEKEFMKDHVLDFEPHLALFVEDDSPLIFYDSILNQAKHLLKENGWIYFEINEVYGEQMIELLRLYSYQNIELKLDLQNKPRMIRGQKTKP